MTEKRQQMQRTMMEIYAYIDNYTTDNGYPPSVRDIANNFSIKSTATVHQYLTRLEAAGLIRKNTQLSRAIEVVNSSREIRKKVINVPLVGEVAAGLPSLAEQSYEDCFSLPVGMFSSSEDLFLLTVKGESMIEAGILPGDLIVVKKQPNANDGQIVVALIGEEATVKRFYRDGNYVRLHPENHTMRDMTFRSDLQILGIVVGLIRRGI